MCKYKHEVWSYQVGSCMYVALLFGRIFSAHRTPNSLLLFEAILELLSWWPKGMLSVLWTSAFPHNWSKSLWILKQHITPEFSVFVRKVWAVCAALRVLWQSPGRKQHSLSMPREQRTEYIVQLLWTNCKGKHGGTQETGKGGARALLGYLIITPDFWTNTMHFPGKGRASVLNHRITDHAGLEGTIRSIKTNCCPYTGHPKNSTMCLRAFSKHVYLPKNTLK